MEHAGRTTGERIKSLRKHRGESQAGLGAILGVKRAIVSSWENDDPIRKPSSAIYLKLSALAHEPKDVEWFLQRAGIERRAIFGIADKLDVGKIQPAGAKDVVRISPIAGGRDIGELILPRSRVANPNFTFYAIGLPDLAWMVLTPGLIVLDTKDAGDLISPFWHEIVVAKVSRGPYESPKFVVGKVHPPFSGHHRTASPGSHSAVLAASSIPEYHEGLHLGTHAHKDWGKPEFHKRLRDDQEFALHVYEDVARHAYREMKTLPGIEIVGKVIAWFPHEKHGARGDK